MDKTRLHFLGHRLRREFRVPDDLPFPMRKALEALADPDPTETESKIGKSGEASEKQTTEAGRDSAEADGGAQSPGPGTRDASPGQEANVIHHVFEPRHYVTSAGGLSSRRPLKEA